MILEKHYFILASQSPRRKILLKTILPKFEIIASDINENAVSYKTPVEYCQKVARLKALNVSDKLKKLNKTAIIISADTIVVLGNKIYGKPENATAAKDYIIELSGKIHQVITAFTILDSANEKLIEDYEISEVCIKKMDNSEIEEYIQNADWHDKAGGYAIQDMKKYQSNSSEIQNQKPGKSNFDIVEFYKGSYNNIVGFPTEKFYEKIKRFIAI